MDNSLKIASQGVESDMECSDNENDGFDDYDYYNILDDNDIEQIDPSKTDPENFVCDCLYEEQVERLLNETVECLSYNLKITPSLAKVYSFKKFQQILYLLISKVLLLTHQWNVNKIIENFRKDASGLLINSKIKPAVPPAGQLLSRYLTCSVCVTPQTTDKFFSLSCAHLFCKECWVTHFEVQINQVNSLILI